MSYSDTNMATKCQCTECHCNSVLMTPEKDGKYICSICRLGKHQHKD
ncbi:MAG: hypothetical protein KGI28_00325 [Thaumarchaeota archaeon]|nr:hypothetical protein [Nitrososphaerota archaeon]